MASLDKLQNEILLKEEAFLKEERAKLTDQLKKLKVEEMALMKLLKQDGANSQQTTIELFCKTSQAPLSSSLKIDKVNHIPLQGLNATEMNHDSYQGEEEEEEEDEDEDDMDDDEPAYSQQLMNAMSNMHQQSTNVDLNISRSVLQNVLQQEIEGFDDEEEEGNFY